VNNIASGLLLKTHLYKL